MKMTSFVLKYAALGLLVAYGAGCLAQSVNIADGGIPDNAPLSGSVLAVVWQILAGGYVALLFYWPLTLLAVVAGGIVGAVVSPSEDGARTSRA